MGQTDDNMIWKNLLNLEKTNSSCLKARTEAEASVPINDPDYMKTKTFSELEREKQKSETKNIPKNYGRAIISFMLANEKLLERVFSDIDPSRVRAFKLFLLREKKTIKTISGLRNLWLSKRNKFAKETRILSGIFLRRNCLGYIFNSRITDYRLNIKYSSKMLEGVHNPERFSHLKDF